MKETIVKCDQCGCVVRDMHMGMEVTPLEGALQLGDWREEDWQFCGIVCLNNYIMENWPDSETIEINQAITAGKVMLTAFRQGVLSGKNAQWLIWSICKVMGINDILVMYPEWNPEYKVEVVSRTQDEYDKEFKGDFSKDPNKKEATELHDAFLKTDSRGA